MKKVLITGASGGIGSALALAFAREGHAVVLHCHKNKKSAAELAEYIAKTYKTPAFAVSADVSSPDEVNTMFDEIDREWGALDVLINNAGIAEQRLFTDITPECWRRMIGVNLDGAFYCSRQALKRYMLRAHSGIILNISSMWGQAGASCEVHYSAAKAGLIGMTKALAKEVGLSGVRVNCICPGVIMTDMMSGFDEAALNSLKDDTPLNTLGTPEDVAEAALFLCGDGAKFITGQILGVNGGMVI